MTNKEKIDLLNKEFLKIIEADLEITEKMSQPEEKKFKEKRYKEIVNWIHKRKKELGIEEDTNK